MKILKFEATWCGPCKSIDSIIESLNLDTDIEKIDIDENQDVVRKFDVRSVPTLIKLNEKGEELERIKGVQHAENLAQFLKE